MIKLSAGNTTLKQLSVKNAISGAKQAINGTTNTPLNWSIKRSH